MDIILFVILSFVFYGAYIFGPIFLITLIITIAMKCNGKSVRWIMALTIIFGALFALALFCVIGVYTGLIRFM